MSDVLLVGFAALALAFAILVVVVRQPMRAALALIAHMGCLAAIYACLEVHVVALFQVLIYVGAVMVFMVYTIMLLDDHDDAYRQRFSRTAASALLVAVAVAAAILALVWGPSPAPAPPADFAGFGFAAFSRAFMAQYWFHFELATVLLLAGMVAAWTAIREHR